MMRRAWVIAGIWAASLAAALAVGRFTARPQVKTVETVKTEWRDRIVERVVTKTVAIGARHVVTRTERQPSGAVVITRTEDASRTATTGTASDTTAAAESATDRTTVNTPAALPTWHVAAGAGWTSFAPRPSYYQASLGRRVVGPFWLLASADTDRHATLSIAFEW
jgi:hypothetical protein